jgi:hypothetical protein
MAGSEGGNVATEKSSHHSMNGLVRHPKRSQKQIGSFDSSQCVIACSLLTSTGRDVGESPGDDMIALSETALTLVVVKAIAIVG